MGFYFPSFSFKRKNKCKKAPKKTNSSKNWKKENKFKISKTKKTNKKV